MQPGDDLPTELLDALKTGVDRSKAPLMFPRPLPGNPARFVAFATFAEWSDYILGFEVNDAIPLTVRMKLSRARKLYLLG